MYIYMHILKMHIRIYLPKPSERQGDKMKVLNSPIEIAGQMGILCKELIEKNIKAIAWNTFHSYLGYKDYLYNIDCYEIETMIQDAIRYFDIFHFHYAATLTTDHSDLEQIKAAGKSMIMHHWGNDVRTDAIAKLNNPYVYTGDSPPPEQIDNKLKQLTKYIEYAIVQDHEVLPYVLPYYKKVFVIPIALDVLSIEPSYPSIYEEQPLLIHAPTNPLFKGTAFIEAAIEQLKHEGLSFRYKRIEKMSNQQAIKFYQEADIVVDQILCGSYGMLAVEAMSLGKPVVGYIRDDLQATFSNALPIYSANPATIYDVLKDVITNPDLRLKLGNKGRKYTKQFHDVRNIASQLISIYREIGSS